MIPDSFVYTPEILNQMGSCQLLELPVELQLAIYELVLVSSEPLLLNCPCNSTFRERRDEYKKVNEQWRTGAMHPPVQLGLLLTCRYIRQLCLPLFYSENIFRACYCHPFAGKNPMLPPVVKWLRMIGRKNRELLRHLYFYDRNERYDTCASALGTLKASEIFWELNGKMETLSTENCCAHLVWFGHWERMQGEVPVALQEGGKKLRLTGEI